MFKVIELQVIHSVQFLLSYYNGIRMDFVLRETEQKGKGRRGHSPTEFHDGYAVICNRK